MTSQLREAHDLLRALRRLKHKDCIAVIEHLNDQGIELLCELIHHLIQGHLPLYRRTKTKLRRLIQQHLKEFKALTRLAKGSHDVERKRGILKKGGILGTLIAIGSALIPILADLIDGS